MKKVSLVCENRTEMSAQPSGAIAGHKKV
jgi:hypothetical protein